MTTTPITQPVAPTQPTCVRRAGRPLTPLAALQRALAYDGATVTLYYLDGYRIVVHDVDGERQPVTWEVAGSDLAAALLRLGAGRA